MGAESQEISPEHLILAPCPGCTDDIVTSDHSPVFGTFEVGVTSQFISKKGNYLECGLDVGKYLGGHQ